MASYIIHMCVAKEINKKLMKDSDKLYLGSIAPDLSRLVGLSKIKSHFIDNKNFIPNVDVFLDKYKNNLDNDFVMGYFIHIYTDYMWFKYVMGKYDFSNKEILNDIYNDYDILNKYLMNKYKLDIDTFNKKIEADNIIEEIDLTNIDLLLKKAKEYINKEKTGNLKYFSLEMIIDFISKISDKFIEKYYDLC